METVVSSLPWLDKLCLEGGCLWHLVVNDSCWIKTHLSFMNDSCWSKKYLSLLYFLYSNVQVDTYAFKKLAEARNLTWLSFSIGVSKTGFLFWVELIF